MAHHPLRVLVCGGRTYTDQQAVFARLRSLPSDAIIVHGGARGADALAVIAAWFLGLECHAYPADWATYGRAAGPIRNRVMLEAEHPDLVLAFPGGRGTDDLVRQAEKKGIPVEHVT